MIIPAVTAIATSYSYDFLDQGMVTPAPDVPAKLTRVNIRSAINKQTAVL